MTLKRNIYLSVLNPSTKTEADMLGSSSTGIFAAGKSSVKAPGQFPFPFTLSEYDALSLRWKILSALYESSSLVILPWG